MKIIESTDSESFVAPYQSLEVARLNEALKANGISSREVRRAICEQYFFDQGAFIDGGWFMAEGTRVGPVLAYAIRDAGGTIKELHLPEPNTGSMYHEYAHGAVAWLFDDKKEDASEIDVGDWAQE